MPMPLLVGLWGEWQRCLHASEAVRGAIARPSSAWAVEMMICSPSRQVTGVEAACTRPSCTPSIPRMNPSALRSTLAREVRVVRHGSS